VLVNKTIEPAGSGVLMGYSGASDVCDHGIYAFLDAWGHFVGLDIRTGAIRWTSPKMDEPWTLTASELTTQHLRMACSNRAGYSGVYAFDWDTGDIVWKYEAPAVSTFETPYIDEEGNTIMSFNGVAYAADGKIYTINTEHTPTQPITRAGSYTASTLLQARHIQDNDDGSMALSLTDTLLSQNPTQARCMSWQGKSQTTVTAPDTSVPQGTALVIKAQLLTCRLLNLELHVFPKNLWHFKWSTYTSRCP